MDLLQAISYGIVQGLGEFLPISSSAHLIALPQIFGWQDPGLSFDVALHLGTLAALLLFFWKDWLRLIHAGFTNIKSTDGKLFWFIIIASIPGAIIGKLLEKHAETIFRNLLLIGIMLIVMGLILYVADKFSKKKDSIEKIGFWRSFGIGVSQALAIVPGVSRSGITITLGLFLGLNKESAARFSFLLSTPIVLGAGLLKLKDLAATPINQLPFLLIGVTFSALTGFLCIKFLLNYLKTKGFGIFVIYRILLGIFFITFYLLKFGI
ncbi:MAG: undecaprenyl-diphosphatase UppP [Candidatus Margulisiibacteriota bacterium]|jgi:undecaprenyl-diphosphatase